MSISIPRPYTEIKSLAGGKEITVMFTVEHWQSEWIWNRSYPTAKLAVAASKKIEKLFDEEASRIESGADKPGYIADRWSARGYCRKQPKVNSARLDMI